MGIAGSKHPGAGVTMVLAPLLALILSACAVSPTATHHGATQTPTWTPPPTATPSPAPPPIRGFQQAWGAAPVIRLPTGLANNQQIFEFANAATPDGQWLVGAIEPRAFANPTGFMPYLAAYNVHTRQIARIHDLATTKSGIVVAATDGTWFVWQEVTNPGTDGAIGVTDGVVRVANWKTGAYRQYTQAMLGSLVVEHGKALWSQITPNEPNASAAARTAIVRLADLNAGTLTTLATNATGAALSWPWAGWGVQTDTTGDGYLQFKDLATGQTTQSTPVAGQTIQSLAYSLTLHGVTAFVVSYGSEIDEMPDVSKSATPRMIFDNSSPGIGPVTTDGRLAAWNGSSTPIPLVWDSAQRALITLPATTGQVFLAWTGASLLLWYDSTETTTQAQADEAAGLLPLATLCVVNTSALPTAPPV